MKRKNNKKQTNKKPQKTTATRTTMQIIYGHYGDLNVAHSSLHVLCNPQLFANFNNL